jgi:hypothetical protein
VEADLGEQGRCDQGSEGIACGRRGGGQTVGADWEIDREGCQRHSDLPNKMNATTAMPVGGQNGVMFLPTSASRRPSFAAA